jgi:hypothetical protein
MPLLQLGADIPVILCAAQLEMEVNIRRTFKSSQSDGGKIFW